MNEDGSLKAKSQTAQVVALRFGLLTDASKTRVIEDLLALLAAKEGPASSGMTSGALGTRSLLPVLTWTGNHNVALRLLQTPKYPSWGYGVDQGATTLRSSWGPTGKKRRAQDPELDQSFGAVSGWLMSKVAGIDTTIPGFQRIRLEPWVPERQEGEAGAASITWVKAHYSSRRGLIEVHWKRREDGSLLYECDIPVQTTATVRLPASPEASVLIDGRALGEDNRFEGGFVQKEKKGRITLNLVKSGAYRIEVK